MRRKSLFVVIPNWNGADRLAGAIDSVLGQSYSDFELVIVDNGSTDGSRRIIERYAKKDTRVRSIYRDKNYGYTGGVNPGLQMAIDEGAAYAAVFNNDALADKHWLKHLVESLEKHPHYGIAACKLLHADGKTFDSTGDQYTVWGLTYPRGRDEPAGDTYDKHTDIFGASGGASLYRVAMLEQIGLFDQDFFAYYEDVDLSFRAHLGGWKVRFVPESIVYHEQGKTSGAMPGGFTTYQTLKNLPFMLWKNLPASVVLRVLPRFALAYSMFFVRAFQRGQGWPATKGLLVSLFLLPKKLTQRYRIQKRRKVKSAYIWSIMTHDLPPNAHKLRTLRRFYHRILGKGVV